MNASLVYIRSDFSKYFFDPSKKMTENFNIFD